MARKRVLIVDDDGVTRALIRRFLEAVDYEAVEAAEGPDGLAKAESLRPDVILLDVQMPGLDGYQVCQGLKENPETKHIPVIFVTMVDDASLNRLAYQAGAAACITKPMRREALVAVVEAALASAERRAKRGTREGGEDGP